MKTIWIIYPYGGELDHDSLGSRQIRFGKMFADNGYKVIFWTADFSHGSKKRLPEGKINICENFDMIRVPTSEYKKNISLGRILFEWKYSLSLAKAFSKEQPPDLFLVPMTGFVTAFYPVWPYIKEHPTPVIYDIMDVHMFKSYMKTKTKMLMPIMNMIAKFIEIREKPFYKHVNAVCGLGANQLQIAINRTGKKDIPNCLVYNGIFVDEFREKMNKPFSLTCSSTNNRTSFSSEECPRKSLPTKEKDWTWCIYAGSLGPSYDIETIVKCAEKVRDHGDKILFIMAGAGPQEKLIASQSQKNDRIVFLGFVARDDLPALYKQCDIGLCTYASYSTVDMPDKFYDYTAAGLAIVNSLQGEVKEHITKGGAGVQYEAGNSDSLYDAIKRIAGKKGYKEKSYAMAEKFDLCDGMKKLLAMVDTLTN